MKCFEVVRYTWDHELIANNPYPYPNPLKAKHNSHKGYGRAQSAINNRKRQLLRQANDLKQDQQYCACIILFWGAIFYERTYVTCRNKIKYSINSHFLKSARKKLNFFSHDFGKNVAKIIICILLVMYAPSQYFLWRKNNSFNIATCEKDYFVIHLCWKDR